MKIDYFEIARKSANRTFSFDDFLLLLKEKFDERMPQRLQKLSRISLYNKEFSQMNQLTKSLESSIDKYRTVLRYHIVNEWILSKNPFSSLSNDLFLDDGQEFVNFYDLTVKDWHSWCKDHGYQEMNTNLIIHNLIMRELPIEKFVALNPPFAEEDKRIHDIIFNGREEILQKNTFSFTSAFQENPKLLEAAQRYLKQAFSTPLPLDKCTCLNKALHNLVFVLTFEGHKDVGADEWIPMTILLMVHHQPDKLASTIEYINHFLMKLSDPPFCSKLIDDTVEYTFTMVSSAKIHFGNPQ